MLDYPSDPFPNRLSPYIEQRLRVLNGEPAAPSVQTTNVRPPPGLYERVETMRAKVMREHGEEAARMLFGT